MSNEHAELARLIMGRTTTAAVNEILAAGYRKQPQPSITITPCDPEAYARGHNAGFEEAITQGLADDPTLADDWFQSKRREAKAEALREAAAELSGLQYVRPNAEGRAEYEGMLAIRRGNTDAWLKARAEWVERES
ncbi:hypothetical protein [Pseudarthrobacter polychromogenes]|uniref:Uncharacterized protein n=1 Tax=Pseudarthrobacter polychromogenes TaxID=1676 RepID=A0ABQ1Y2K4_9MICC|nr:hypothetical protein [Pseudarthrobacter polychromogenes]GGH10306.1 hypothetical protein GCM10011577_39060 [Pseudarthrobacter polychromogenes]